MIAALKDTESWIRSALHDVPPHFAIGIVRHAVDEMLGAGLVGEAASWAAVGIRIARARGWRGYQAVFYGYRAVALAKRGLTHRASICRQRASIALDAGDRWTPALLVWADGLIYGLTGDKRRAAERLSKSVRLFNEIGSAHHASFVEMDLGAHAALLFLAPDSTSSL
ncbi:MAG TPA: hypothetical protein DE036_04500 [Actinobacteria bacterium]|nr:hypothetical protein [Actinomycetota bacterium]